jgi:hypothetical protein
MARILLILLALLFLAPIGLTIFVSGASMGIGAIAMVSMFNAVSKPEVLPRKPEWNVVNVNAGSANARGYTTLVNRQDLAEGRIVRIYAYLSFDEVRGTDTTPVHPDERETYVRTSAPRLARNECEVILAVFASKCVVSISSVSSIGSRDVYRIELGLMYVEKAELGNVGTQNELSFIQSHVVLNRNSAQSTRVGRLGQAALRREFYQDAVTLCVRQRQQHGNCSLQSVYVNAGYDERNHMVNVAGAVDIAILQSQTTAQRLTGQSR